MDSHKGNSGMVVVFRSGWLCDHPKIRYLRQTHR